MNEMLGALGEMYALAGRKAWVTNGKNCWEVGEAVDEVRHYPLITKGQARMLRLRDALERKAGSLLEHRPPRKR